MTAALVSLGLLAVGALGVWAGFYYAPRRHSGSGEGALTVSYLIERAEAEAGGGRHRLREREPRTLQLRGDLGEALANETTRILPLAESGLPVEDYAALARHPGLLRRMLVGLDRIEVD